MFFDIAFKRTQKWSWSSSSRIKSRSVEDAPGIWSWDCLENVMESAVKLAWKYTRKWLMPLLFSNWNEFCHILVLIIWRLQHQQVKCNRYFESVYRNSIIPFGRFSVMLIGSWIEWILLYTSLTCSNFVLGRCIHFGTTVRQISKFTTIGKYINKNQFSPGGGLLQHLQIHPRKRYLWVWRQSHALDSISLIDYHRYTVSSHSVGLWV